MAKRRAQLRSLREVITIDDDDSTSEQSAVKVARREDEPVSPPEVVELQQKVVGLEQTVTNLEHKLAKSEKTCQGAIRFAAEGQARIQFLENLVDDKRNILDKPKNMEDAVALEEKVAELTHQLKEERTNRVKDRERIEELTTKLEQFKQSNDGMELIPDFTRPPPPSPQIAQAIVNTPTIVFDRSNGEADHIPDFPRPPPPPPQSLLLAQMTQTAVNTPPKIHENAHPTNVFKLCRPDTSESIPLDKALSQLQSAIAEYGRERVLRKNKRRLMGGKYEVIKCELCQKSIVSRDVLSHLLGETHIGKARAHEGAISLAAYQHWFCQPTSAAAAAPAAVAASSTGSETTEGVEQ